MHLNAYINFLAAMYNLMWKALSFNPLYFSEGYLTFWDIGKFLRNPETEEPEAVKQIICWRAHLTKVVSLTYIDAHKAILSASTDGSARFVLRSTVGLPLNFNSLPHNPDF